MNQQELTQVVDEALERFRGRDLVASAEVVDVLLDLRLLLLEVESLEQLLDEPEPHPPPRRSRAPPLRYTRVRMADEVSPRTELRKRRHAASLALGAWSSFS